MLSASATRPSMTSMRPIATLLRRPTWATLICLIVGLARCSDNQAGYGGEAALGGTATLGGSSTSTATSVTGMPSSSTTGGVSGSATSGAGGGQAQGGNQAQGGDQTQGGANTSGGGLQRQGGASTGATGFGGSSTITVTSGGMGGLDSAGQGGNTGEAASVTTGATEGGGDGCAPDSVVCDGFEDYASGSPPDGAWAPRLRGNGSIVVDTTRAFSGTQSLHVTGKLNADEANISMPIETQSEILHVRFMMYTVSYPASSGVHTRLAELGVPTLADGAPYSAYSLSTYNGTAIEKVNSIYLRDTGTHMDDPDLKNRWVCWEFGIDKTGGEGNVEVHIWVDGRDLPLSPAGSSSHGMTSASWDPIDFDLFEIGLFGYQADEQLADFWLDDVLVIPTRVGCPEVSPNGP